MAALPDVEGPDPARRGPGGRDIKSELGLNDSQYAQLKKLRMDGRKAAIRRRADLQIARLELGEMLDTAAPDEKAIAAKVKEVSELQTAALKARVDARLAVAKILTPEQREKLKHLRGLGLRRERGPAGREHGRGARARPGRGAQGAGPDEELTESEAE
jgi:Spy/CpxP family protein refolding chaperone